MRKGTLGVLAIGAAALLTLTACGGDTGNGDVKVEENPEFAKGSVPAKIAEEGRIKIGVKVDQPGLGYKKPGTETPEGFDIDVATQLAAGLGVKPDDIEWTETVSKNREPFLQKGTVDLVLASYSITDERRQVVGQAGPYLVTGQGLLVRKDDNSIKGGEDLKGKKVCSVTGSTSLKQVKDLYDARPVAFGTYSECLTQVKNNSVDALTTDESILLGYAAEDPEKVKVVGKPFTEERYGIGYKKDDAEMCKYLNESLTKMFEDGTWKKAFDDNLGEAGVDAPKTPKLDPCS